MTTLKRDKSGAFILRYWTAGRGSKLVYRILGRLPYREATERARAIIDDNEQESDLEDNRQEPNPADNRQKRDFADNRQDWDLADARKVRNRPDTRQNPDVGGPSAIFRRLTERWFRR
ncbi:MAG: hypothetical protein ACHQPI_01585 [Thermoanaerobaculia bacterium]